MAKAADLLAVVVQFADGNGELYRQGDPIEPDHWAVKKWPQFFGPLVLRHPIKRTEPRVEAATAAPGEKRGG